MPATDLLTKEDVFHLLRRAAFGPTKKDLSKFEGKSRASAVDQLLPSKGRKKSPPRRKDDNRDELRVIQKWWLKQMQSKKWRAAEKLTLFWHDHFPSSFDVVRDLEALGAQNGTFRTHCLGNFRDMVFDITRDAAMLDYLDGFRNQKDSPNENYGREVMELFGLGVTDLAGNDNYTQEDVVQMARCCTGFVAETKQKKNRTVFTGNTLIEPSRFDDGSKTLFAGTGHEAVGNIGVENADGLPFPPNLNAIDILFTHRDTDGRPTAARFIAKKLWEWYAYPDPSTALIDELADIFVAANYEIRPLVYAILTHDEFYSATSRESTAKSPVDFTLQGIAALEAKTKLDELPDFVRFMGMDLFNPPSVNGWNHSSAWLSTSRFLERFEFAQELAAGRDKKIFKVTPKKLLDPNALGTGAMVDGLLDRMGVTVPDATRQALIDYLDGGNSLEDEEWLETKFRGVFVLLLTLPEYQVH
ncbi:MAG: DUF1800 domain-containing protein [Myxococcota bacterium]